MLFPHLGKAVVSVFLFFTFFNVVKAQDLVLTVNQLKNWQQTTTNAANISYTPIAPRSLAANHQIHSNLNKDFKILYSPDGMNNWAPYVEESSQFNLFNFSHWQYIDMLAWFGGSASETVLIPSKSWVDAAHQNGVKVTGCVFFAPAAWGGSQSTLLDFLEQDANGDFIAVNKMVEIADYYNFDGWLLNFETSVSASVGALAKAFVADLKAATNKEIIWYDAMLPSGPVSWQNELNNSNSYFFENSTGMFTNYWWGATQVNNSAAHASGLGRSPYDVYMGADMWPDRNNQTAFTNSTWINNIVSNGNAKTSIAVFATNFTFNYPAFSDFQNDPSDLGAFYSTENKIFSGVDGDPFEQDGGWKGLSDVVPVRTAITSFPFITSFNLGHGKDYYDDGNVATAGDWHNMSLQSIPPSWTFKKDGLNILGYAFDDAYDGGSCLSITSGSGGSFNIPLYSTEVDPITELLGTSLTYKVATNNSVQSITIELVMASGSTIESPYYPSTFGDWESGATDGYPISASEIVTAINLKIEASSGFGLKIGKMVVRETTPVSTIDPAAEASLVKVFPNPSSGELTVSLGEAASGKLRIFALDGSLVLDQQLARNNEIITLPKGVYFYELSTSKTRKTDKLIIK